jgi:hypothetical protein
MSNANTNTVALTKGAEKIEIQLSCGPDAPFGYLVRDGKADRRIRIDIDRMIGAGWERA